MNILLKGCLSLIGLMILSVITAVLAIAFEAKRGEDVYITGSDILNTAIPIFVVLLILRLLGLWIDISMKRRLT